MSSTGKADELFVTVTRAANHSALWLAIAGALALSAGPRGKRGALRGVLAISLASATVNGPFKLIAHRRRPNRRRLLIRRPSSSSFPSGHSASAFAFATAVSQELPGLVPLLVPLAATVAYSRVHVGVHYPSDVVSGSAIGVAVGLATRSIMAPQRATVPQPGPMTQLPREVVLVTSPHAGSSHALEPTLATMRKLGITIAERLEIEHLDRLSALIRADGGPPRLVVAAGGDGTVGAVADSLANSDNVLGVFPLGTSNDFARSLGIPADPQQAALLLTQGKIATIDLGRVISPGQPARHFVHAATVGLNVNFAKLATRASIRDHLGRLTYLVAAAYAFRDRPSFVCELHYDGHTHRLTLAQLSVINAPVFGGPLGLSIGGSSPDDRLLDVLAIEDIPLRRMILAALFLLRRIKRQVHGVQALHLSRLHVHAERELEIALDGEIVASLPADFEVAGEALRVITPLDFEDIDDDTQAVSASG
jgi:YegS/Rv2252/BmrU family lipid kinase